MGNLSNPILLPCLLFSSFFIIFLFLSQHPNPLLNFSPTTLAPLTKLKLQTSFDGFQEARAVLLSNSSTSDRLKKPSIRKVGKPDKRQKLEVGLARARAAIRKAVLDGNISRIKNEEKEEEDARYVPKGGIYRNAAAFYQSYLEMEKRFKVFVYQEGEVPLVHDGPCKNIYTIEGRFIHELELRSSRFLTRDPGEAHVYFMPFSVVNMVTFLYKPFSYDLSPLQHFLNDYIKVISSKYPFWNASFGADHFMLSCHDWTRTGKIESELFLIEMVIDVQGPYASRANPHLFNTSIRVLCNANTSEGFNPVKDVSLPEINLRTGEISSQLVSDLPESKPTHRKYLAFFAGGVHGPIRPLLLRHWKEIDPDVRVYEYLPRGLDYYSLMRSSKYCLCPSGYEVASPRIVEAIYADCVPVIISDHYVLPFNDVLRWEAFSVRISANDIPNIKSALRGISEEEYMRLKEGVKAVKRHFVLNQPAKRFDVFHMILHSIWLRRLNVKLV